MSLAVVATALATAAAIVAALMMVLVFLNRPSAHLNRLLGGLLLVETLGASSGMPLGANRAAVHAMQEMFTYLAYPVMPFVYLWFIAHAVPRPLTRRLRTKTARWLLVGIVLTVPAIMLTWRPDARAVHDACEPLVLGVALFGLASAWRQRREAQGAQRRKATHYLAAFGAQDLGFITGITVLITARRAYGITAELGPETHTAIFVGNGIISIGILLTVILLSYGLFRNQVLDFHFRLHRRISQGTVAAIFIGLFFVVSEVTAELLSEQIGPVLGIVATGLLVFALAPLQRLGNKVGSVVVEDARPLDARTPAENEALFQEQLELALEDGALTLSEMRMLETFRVRLGLSPERAAVIQSTTAQRLAG